MCLLFLRFLLYCFTRSDRLEKYGNACYSADYGVLLSTVVRRVLADFLGYCLVLDKWMHRLNNGYRFLVCMVLVFGCHLLQVFWFRQQRKNNCPPNGSSHWCW